MSINDRPSAMVRKNNLKAKKFRNKCCNKLHWQAVKRHWENRRYMRATNWRKLPRCERHQDTSTFTLFFRLPLELRVMIWKFSFRGRTVETYVDLFDAEWRFNGYLQEERSNYPCKATVCKTVTPNPVTLFINHESRMVTLKHYFDLIPQPPNIPTYFDLIPQPPNIPTYFNFQLDSFAMRTFNSAFNLPGDDMSKIVLAIKTLMEYTSSPLLRSIKSFTFSGCNIYVYDFRSGNSRVPTRTVRPVYTDMLLDIFDHLEEIIIISGTPYRKSLLSGFEDPTGVRGIRDRFAEKIEMKKEKDPSFKAPQITIYTEPFRIPIFCDEMQEAYDSRAYEDYDLGETADWFDSEY
ncbi:hypothetical protein NHQ30_004276 [Ciborinia camelliae]|nr:hypothetical protein NHQ30_004276 [Ciborinia camelliae]